jgi:hypothetical protein
MNGGQNRLPHLGGYMEGGNLPRSRVGIERDLRIGALQPGEPAQEATVMAAVGQMVDMSWLHETIVHWHGSDLTAALNSSWPPRARATFCY